MARVEAELRLMLSCFQFLGIPPKGELRRWRQVGELRHQVFPISRDPPEGGTC